MTFSEQSEVGLRRDIKQLLIIGAGPYGLSIAAYAKRLGLDYQLLGDPMAFWKRHMPKGLILRSNTGEHINLDPAKEYTFDHYMREVGLKADDVYLIPLERFLNYAAWVQSRAGVEITSVYVRKLEKADGLFQADLDDESKIWAKNVVVATGLRDHKNLPELTNSLPKDRCFHTCEAWDLSFLRGQRCLIVGGRQSAFEWAALIGEEDAAEIQLVYRHPTPAFEEADWSSLEDPARQAHRDRRWFRKLSASDKEKAIRRLWTEGRLKIEPWLEPRIRKENVRLWPRTTVKAYKQRPDGSIEATLDSGTALVVDYVLLATGYKINVANFTFLSKASIMPNLMEMEGDPVLDEDFQSSVPGLFFAGSAAARDFGPAFGFVIGCTVAAKAIVQRVGIHS